MRPTVDSFSLEQLQEGTMLLIDKPLHWTSFDVVNRIRVAICKFHNIKKLKVGHAGTLDPLATGLLILCTGKWTRRIDEIQAQVKGYSGIIQLGQVTASYDLETEPTGDFQVSHIDQHLIDSIKPLFLGELMQTPPIFSAIKKEGKRSYDLARAGKETTMEARQVHISQLELKLREGSKIDFSVICSKGTYIRSLANDIGQSLHSGAYLAELRRFSIGQYSVMDALSMDEFLKFFIR